MNRVYRHTVAIGLILLISLAVGLAYNALADLVERHLYPQDFTEYVTTYATRYGIPEDVVYATIKVESNFDPMAVSSAGAIGLMQMIPSTFEWLTGDVHLGEHLTPNMLYDPEVNIRYGVYYLKYLYSKFDHNWSVTCAAYNGGEGNVSKWLADERYSDGEGNITHFPEGFGQTKAYVKKIAKARQMYLKLYY
jgi:soluble lytic murein transglycosylase